MNAKQYAGLLAVVAVVIFLTGMLAASLAKSEGATGVMGYVTGISIVVSIVSVVINVYQWRRRVDVQKVYHAHLHTVFNQMDRIAVCADESRKLFGNEQNPSPAFAKVIQKIHQCTGIVDSGRITVLAFSEKYLGRPVKLQHPRQPDPGGAPAKP
jgi:hypothetical protein